MGTEVLRPQADDFNTSHTPPFHHRRRGNPNLTLLINDKISADRNKNNKAKKSPITKKAASDLGCKDDVIKVKKLVKSRVTLLKRGDTLDSIVTKSNAANPPNSIDDIAIRSVGRMGPESPIMVPKQIRVPERIMYAGSVIMTSPSPRALPQPSFFSRKRENGELVLDDFATKDLRRLLRLE